VCLHGGITQDSDRAEHESEKNNHNILGQALTTGCLKADGPPDPAFAGNIYIDRQALAESCLRE